MLSFVFGPVYAFGKMMNHLTSLNFAELLDPWTEGEVVAGEAEKDETRGKSRKTH